jgi:hypothetical protein
MFMVAGWLVAGSGLGGRGLGAGGATTTSATDVDHHRPAVAPGRRTGGRSRCRSTRSRLVAGMLVAFGARDDRQEGVGQHGQGHPPVPGAPAAHLMLIQPAQALGGAWKDSSTLQRHPATRARAASEVLVGAAQR